MAAPGFLSALLMAVFVAGGGAMGFVTKGSIPSAAAGFGFGLLYAMAAAGLYSAKKPLPVKKANTLACLASVVLAVVFGVRVYVYGVNIQGMAGVIIALAVGSATTHFKNI
jgi:uncharacterized membrane protein (UPF0136 family)